MPAAQRPSAQSLTDAAATARAEARIRALHREADALAGQARSLLGDLRKLEIERDLRLEEVRRLDTDAADLARQVAAIEAQISATQAELDRAQPGLQARLVEIYKMGSPGYARLVLGVDDVRDVGRATRMAATLAAQDQRRIAEFIGHRTRLQSSQAALARESARLSALRAEAALAASRARKAADSRTALLRDIDARRDLTSQMVAELDEARARIEKAIASPAGADAASTALPLRPFRGALEWPADGRVISRFGQHRNPAHGTLTVQNGIEIEGALGNPVRAVHEGRVAFADVFAGFGQLVIVDHGNLAYSLYGHLDRILVSRGDRVLVGQTLGACGRGPRGDPAVYFELRIDAKPVDPVQWLKAR